MRHYLFTVLLLISCTAFAQNEFSDKGYQASLGAAAIGTSNNTVPFWMRSNQYGSIPLDGLSASAFGTIGRNYKEDTMVLNGGFDWGFGVSGRLNAGNSVRGQLIEAYAKIKYSVFELKAGRSRDAMGLVDTSLSSGAFAVSGTALGIPKIEISIPDFWTIPVWDGLFAIKGNFVHGWMGSKTLDSTRSYVFEGRVQTYYHQKSFYGRLGKESWKVKLMAGFNHQVAWGGEWDYFQNWDLSQAGTFLKVVTGGVHKDSKVGNHLGSIDQAITYDFEKLELTGYHQFFYDVGGLAHLSNIKDGLWGLSATNKSEKETRFRWNKMLLEFLYSKSQGGELGAKVTPSGDEDYYNNYIYTKGWSYLGENIGNPLFTNRRYSRDLPVRFGDYFVSNRVIAFHFGTVVDYQAWSAKVLLTVSRNYGTYGSSPEGKSTGGIRSVGPPPYFTPVSQFSGYFEASRPLKNNFHIGFVIAGDYGELLYNSIGGQIKLSKVF